MRFGRYRGGEKNRVDRDPVAARRLPQTDPAAEQPILGKGRLGGSGVRSPCVLTSGCKQRASPPKVALRHHQAARDRTDAAFDQAGVMVEH